MIDIRNRKSVANQFISESVTVAVLSNVSNGIKLTFVRYFLRNSYGESSE